MYRIFDTEEGKFFDVRDMDGDICVCDSTAFFERATGRRFTTLSAKSKI